MRPQLRADLNYRLPNGTLNPYFLENGYYFSESNLLRLKRTNDNDTLRASLSYEKDLGQRWGFHRFAVMGERYINQESRLRTHEAWANRPFGGFPEDAANRVTRRRYIKIGGPSADYTGGYQPGNPANLEKFTSGFPAVGAITTTWVPRNALDFNDEITTDSLMAVMQNYFFSRRLVTTVGVRDDSITAEGPRVVRDATTGFWRFATSADKAAFAPIGKDWFSSETVSGLRKSIGGVFHAAGALDREYYLFHLPQRAAQSRRQMIGQKTERAMALRAVPARDQCSRRLDSGVGAMAGKSAAPA